jgi:glycosyltransferase involved in cell wall biosynthesis
VTDLSRQLSISFVIPLHDDWESAGLLLSALDSILRECTVQANILLIDDGSSVPLPSIFPNTAFTAISEVEILHLRRNLGHQRAIAIGLAFLHSNRIFDAVVIMDGDGEDRPSDIPKLIARFEDEGRRKIIFAKRARRSESALFKIFYHTYRALHRILTGIAVRVGNFSIVPSGCVDSLMAVPELWNHYAAAVFKSKLPYTTISTSRGPRLSGRSQMHFVSLVMHGLSALAVFAELVGVRLLLTALGLIGLLLIPLGLVLVVGATTQLPALPGRAWFVIEILFLILFQFLLISFLLVFIILFNRSSLDFLPLRDFKYFIRSVDRVFPA